MKPLNSPPRKGDILIRYDGNLLVGRVYDDYPRGGLYYINPASAYFHDTGGRWTFGGDYLTCGYYYIPETYEEV